MGPRITIEEFIKKHPELEQAVLELRDAKSITPDKDGKYSERLLRTASMVYAGKLDPNVKRRTAAHFVT